MLCFQTATLLLVFASIVMVKMFVTVQALQVSAMLFLLEFNDFVLCKCFVEFVAVVFYICSRDFLWYKIDFIRLSHLSAGKLVSCQKTEMHYVFVMA